MPFNLKTEFPGLFESLTSGKLIPFLGAGVNLCQRKPEANWEKDGLLPNGTELAEHLAASFSYPCAESNRELQRISQYASITHGDPDLYQALHRVFSKNYPSTPIHEFLAQAPALLGTHGIARFPPLIITTNYDEVLEDAFRRHGTPFDVVTYVRSRKLDDERLGLVEITGKFWHLENAHLVPSGTKFSTETDPWRVVNSQKHKFPVDERTIILKIHGAVDRADADRCSFVITEDDYIDYLTLMDPRSPIPADLAARISECRFLFLGYALRDWNLRVILQRLTSKRNYQPPSWAVKQPHAVRLTDAGVPTQKSVEQQEQDKIEEMLWERRNIRLLYADLVHFVSDLRAGLDALPLPAAAAVAVAA